MSNFPTAFDTDLELPRVDDNVTEVAGDAINALRDAIFNIESALGLSPAGNKSSLTARVNISIDADGRIKSSALSDIGLVTLPITNSQIASTAGILESKLDLDHTTQSLRNSISSNQTDISGLQTAVDSLTLSFSRHTTGQSGFHDGYHIKVNTGTSIGIVGLSAITIGAAVNEIAGHLFGSSSGDGHIDTSLPNSIRHTAEKISVDSSNFVAIDRSSETVQDALDNIDQQVLDQQSTHVDGFHSNGILKQINSGEFFNPNQHKFQYSDASYTAGSTVVTIASISSFGSENIQSGDILYVEGDVEDVGSYKIRATGPLTSGQSLGNLPSLNSNQLSVFHVFEETQSNITVDGYKAASVSSENAPLVCAAKHNETLVDTITILNPNAARVVSLGFNGAIINGDGYDVHLRVGLGSGQYRELTVPNLNRDRLSSSQSNTVDATSVAERINAYVSDPTLGFHFPVSAFRIGNEIAVAHNLVGESYTLEVLDGYSANFPLGLDAYGADITDLIIAGNTDNLFTVNGISLSTLETTVNGYTEISSDASTFTLYTNSGSQVDPTLLGITPGAIIHFTGHPNAEENGSYVIETVTSSTVSIFSSEPITASSSITLNVKITNSHISLNDLGGAETDNGIVQLFVDQDGKVLVHQRLTYGTDFGSAVEIINVSRGFPVGSITLNCTANGTLRNFILTSDSLSGTTATVHEDFDGSFKVFHSNNIDYLVIKTNSGTIGAGTETVVIYDNINDDEALLLASVHFNGELLITNVIDLRQFGTMGSEQIRDDFIEIFSQQPIADLRSNGVVRGFDILDIPYVDSISNMQALPLNGGTVYINGVRCVVETQKVVIQSHDSSGNILSDHSVIIGINEFGTLRAFNDNLSEILSDGYNSSVEFGKILPLYKVDIVDGGISTTTDIRRFINNLDEKIEIIVDATNNVVGNFRSLEGALLYAENYPNAEKLTIKIINRVFPQRKLTVPIGVSIIGDTPFGGRGKHAIVNQTDLNDDFIELLGDNRLANIQIESELVTMDGALVLVNGSNVDINQCYFTFTDSNPIATSSSDFAVRLGSSAIRNVNVSNNRINNVFSGIVSVFGCENLQITNNEIQNISGTSSAAHGIFAGTSTNAVDNFNIFNNTILVGDVGSGSDIRGISIDVDETIGTLTINNNRVDHEAGTTMTNGIRIENSTTSGNYIEDLIVDNNIINGIKLNDNDIWGMYIGSVTTGLIANNIIKNVGQSGNSEYGFIKLADVTYIDIDNNILEDGAVDRGIDATGITNKIKITRNTFKGLGSNAIYIFGAGQNSTISGNVLTGPGLQGIRWTGANSLISDNNLNAHGVAYAFSEYGVLTLTSGIDIVNNTITGMTIEDCIGISNGGASRDRSKIIGNTIAGDEMATLIELFASDHMVSNNRLYNVSSSSNGTDFILLTSVEDSVISNNLIQGVGTNGINESGTTSGTSFNNNKITATIATSEIELPNATNCDFNGNSMAEDSAIDIGSSLSINTNSLGINPGMLSSISLSYSSGITLDDSGTNHWFLDNTGPYWIGNAAVSPRNLHFPINSLIPNGARLVSINVRGDRTGSDDTLTADVIRQDIESPFSNTQISATSSITATTTFDGTTSSTGLITITTSSNFDLVDYSNYAYSVRVVGTGGATASQIRGIKINFRY